MFIAFVPLQGWNPAKKRGDGFKGSELNLPAYPSISHSPQEWCPD
jgi:hypothetical protein